MHSSVSPAMSLYSIVLLAGIALLTSNSSAAISSPTITQTIPTEINSFDGYHQNGVPTKRFLRTLEATDVMSEERGIDKVTNYIKSATSKVVGSVKTQTNLLRESKRLKIIENMEFADDAASALTLKRLDGLENYVKAYNKQFPDKKTSMIETLTTRYQDDALAKAFAKVQKEAANSDIEVAKRIKQLQEDQREFWYRNTKSVDEVFKRLKLADDGFLALHSRKMKALEDYLTFFNTKTGGQTTLVDVLTVGFGGEAKLMHIISGGKIHPLTMKRALSLQDELIAKLQTNGVHPESMLERLKLNLNTNNLKMVVKYVSDFNANNPTMKVRTLGTLTSYYENDVVAMALASAKIIRGTRTIATRLQTQQFKSWPNSVDDAFTTLKINTNEGLVGPIEKLNALEDYITFFNAKNPLKETTMVEAMSKGFGGEDEFALLVTKALKESGTPRDIRAAASEYQNKLFQQWKNKDLDPMSVLIQVFKVDEAKVASAGAQEKAIIDQYSKFYVAKTDVLDQVPYDIVRPKRF